MDINEIASIVGSEHVLAGDAAAAYSVGDLAPNAAALPGTVEEASRLIGLARERGSSVVPFGGGTQMETGFPPPTMSLALSTRRLNRIVDYQPDDMTVTVEPGVTLSALQQTLAERGQFLPLDPPLPGRATAGGTVAAAMTGPWRSGFGTPRDWVIGCRVLDSDGKEVRGGGQVVKNVAGYDVPKLYTGSYGTLGLITEVTFKVMPRLPAAGYACLWAGDADTVEASVRAIMDSDLQPTVLELVQRELWHDLGEEATDRPKWSLLLEFLHVPDAVEWQLQLARKIAETAGASFELLSAEAGGELLGRLRDRPASYPLVARLAAVSSSAPLIAAAVAELDPTHSAGLRVQAHATSGQVYAYVREGSRALAEALRGLAGEHGASCVFLRLPAALTGRIDPWGSAGPELRLMRGIKQSLDRHNLFSPGRFVGGI